MNKEFVVTLLQKDIAELALITKGFESMEIYPDALIELALAKAKNIEICLQQLHDVAPIPESEPIKEVQVEIQKEETESPVVTLPIEEEIPIVLDPKSVLSETNEISEPEIEIEKEEQKEESVEIVTEEIKIQPEKASVVTRNDMIHNQKIDDVKQAISIGDRFLFQRELFGGNGELMSKTITILNACQTLEDAEQYIAKKFQWDMENPTTERFMQIISRKF